VLAIDQLVRDYGDPYEEARVCRRDCALFDFSFVHRARVSGKNALLGMESFQPRELRNMAIGQIRYSVKTDQQKRVRSDLTLWRVAADSLEVMSGCREDIEELLSLAAAGFEVDDLSADTAIITIQGPNSLDELGRYMDTDALRALQYFGFVDSQINGTPCVIGRLGYSGEQGFEILIDQSSKARLWDVLAEEIAPAGFAALDILRIEAGFFLFTNECRIQPSVTELGLSQLLGLVNDIPEIRFTGFKAESDANPILWQPSTSCINRPAGSAIAVTSACYSPHLGSTIGLGFVAAGQAREPVIDPDNEFHSIELLATPVYDPDKRIPRLPWRPGAR